jgi:Tol biopolymer transport system component
VSLPSGTRLGGYEIISPLGAGGMGEVYRARDTRLNRQVAIKVLPAAFANDPERLARFTREAQTLAALNHPNIAHIHGLEESSGVVALVMELVEGDDLSVLIARGPMPIAEALPIARQIAEALEAAHEEGFIHRDLKPANVKVRPDGTVKLLDFGLAKALAPDDAKEISGTLANSPTVASPAMTAMGVILGTAAYMAPEQARGKGIDRRVDIWAFGVVFYEMLTGVRLFEGESVAETLGLIFSREPDLTRLPVDTPAGIRRIIGRCLVKDPRQRLRDAGDARLLIDDALEAKDRGASGASGAAGAAGATVGKRAPWLIAVAGVTIAAVAAATGWSAKPVATQAPVRLSIVVPAGEQVTTVPAISADGRMVAYAAGRTLGTSQLYLRALDDFAGRPVPGSHGAQYPFFSPDGRSIGFFAGGKLRRASVAGGAAVDLASSPTPWGATWDTENRIVFTTGLGSGLWRISAEGGVAEQLTKPDGGSAGYAHVFPQRLPGTDDLLFTFWGQTFAIAVLSPKSGAWHELTRMGSGSSVGYYSATGHLLGNDNAGTVLASPWQPGSAGRVTPEAPVLDNVNWQLGAQRSWIDVAENGTAVYVPGNPGNRHLVWVDRQGRVTQLPGEPNTISQALLSHDGRRVMFGSVNAQWIVDLESGARARLLPDVRAWNGGWLPGDDRVVFSSNKDGDWDLYTAHTDGTDLKRLLKRPYAQHAEDVAPDGSIIFMERQPSTGSDLWTLMPDGRTVPLAVTAANETSARVSVDGRFVAYTSDESGRNEVYAVASDGTGARLAISVEGGAGPVWSRDGRELFYRAGDDLMSVKVQTTNGLVLGERRKLLDLSAYDTGQLHEFDVSADGEKFLLIRTEPESRPTRLDVVLNWTEALKRTLGTK